MAKTPPPELASAIQASSQKYGVPVDILTGVWIKESGGSFPNNFVNSSGYGGLFGTTNWNGSTQSQSDYSASILAHLHSTYGNWSTALYHYSGGGYTSVPGQTTSGGAVIGGHGTTSTKPNTTGGTNTAPASSNPFDLSGLTNAISGIPNALTSNLKQYGINTGFALLAIVLIIGGILVIIAPAAKGIVETVKPV